MFKAWAARFAVNLNAIKTVIPAILWLARRLRRKWREHVLAARGKAAAGLPKQLGEIATPRCRALISSEQGYTCPLMILERETRGEEQRARTEKDAESIPIYKRCGLDLTNWAMAYAKLGVLLWGNWGKRDEPTML